jgi:hypothetical protein
MKFATRKGILLSIMFALILLKVNSFAQKESPIVIYASGDAHGMVTACDCPQEPGGGLAKRSYFLKTTGGRDSTLLLDAGGFCAGGLYDAYTEGRMTDSVRSLQMIYGMAEMKYDAVVVGDDDLQYGAKWLSEHALKSGLKLVSANVYSSDNTLLFAPYVIVNKNNVRIAITGLTTQEKIVPYNKNIHVLDPVISLKKIWNEVQSKSDIQIVLSHLGQDISKKVLDSIPDIDILINGHRKISTNPVDFINKIPVMQFGFQGKSLSYVKSTVADNKLLIKSSGWYQIGDAIPDDSLLNERITDALKQTKNGSVYDLYIMSQCPYGLEALAEFTTFIKKLPDINYSIWFIGDVENDTSLSSLHGAEEVKDEMIWLAVKELFPEKYLSFLSIRATSNKPTESLLKTMKISMESIDKWIKQNGKTYLAGHYIRSSRLNIKASPTLLINNKPFEKMISSGRLAKMQCGSTGLTGKICDTLPECFDQSDCKMKGKVGLCVQKKCTYTDAVQFKFTVLLADSSKQHPEESIISTTEELFAGAKIDKILFSSNEGKNIIKSYNPDALPFYIFDKEVNQAVNYDQIESGIFEKNNSFVFKKGITRANYFYKRKLEKDKIVLFIDPFFKGITNIFASIFSDSLLAEKIVIAPVFYSNPQNDLWGTEESFRQEEALRWLVMNKYFNGAQKQYLKEYGKIPGNSYWFTILQKINIPADTFVSQLRANSDIIQKQWELLDELTIKEPVVIFLNNQEILGVNSERELIQFLIEK